VTEKCGDRAGRRARQMVTSYCCAAPSLPPASPRPSVSRLIPKSALQADGARVQDDLLIYLEQRQRFLQPAPVSGSQHDSKWQRPTHACSDPGRSAPLTPSSAIGLVQLSQGLGGINDDSQLWTTPASTGPADTPPAHECNRQKNFFSRSSIVPTSQDRRLIPRSCATTGCQIGHICSSSFVGPIARPAFPQSFKIKADSSLLLKPRD